MLKRTGGRTRRGRGGMSREWLLGSVKGAEGGELGKGRERGGGEGRGRRKGGDGRGGGEHEGDRERARVQEGGT